MWPPCQKDSSSSATLLQTSESLVPPKTRMYVENHAQANSVRAKQLAGQRLSQEEEAILEQEGTLEAELRKEREEQERLKSRAGAVRAQKGARCCGRLLACCCSSRSCSGATPL